MLQYTVLVYPRLVGKGIRPYHGLVGLYHDPCNHGDKSAGGVYLLGIDLSGQAQMIPMGVKGHYRFLQRGIPCPFTDPVNGHFNLTGSSLEACQCIGSGESQIVMTMHTQYGLMDTGSMFPDICDQFGELMRKGITHRIW